LIKYQKLFTNYKLINFALIGLIGILYLNNRQRNNIENLAAQAKTIPFEIRVSLNFMVFGVYLILFIFSSHLIKNKITLNKNKLNFKIKFLSGILLVSILFIPAIITSPKFQIYADKLYGFYSIGHLKPNFLDLRAILQAMSSIDFIGETYKTACPGACVQFAWNYPQFLLDLNFVHISESNIYLVASFFAILYLISLILILDDFKTIIFSVGWLMTGSTFLLFERMNSEILIPTLVIINLYLIKKFPNAIYVFPITILFLANLKFYPLILIPVVYYIFRRHTLWLFYNLSIFLIGVFMLYDDILKIGLSAMSFGYPGTFGLKTYLGLLSGGYPSFELNLSAASLIFSIFSGYLIFVGLYSNLTLDLRLIPDQLFLIGSILILASWLTSSSYQYRMAPIILLLPYFSKNLRSNPQPVSLLFFGYAAAALNCAISLAPGRNGLFTGVSFVLVGILIKFIWRMNLKSAYNLAN